MIAPTPKLMVAYLPAFHSGASPYRLIDEQAQEIAWVNDFLDAKHLVQRSPRSLRAYAFDLLHFARWWRQQQLLKLSLITESTLLDYVAYQLHQSPPPTPTTVNHRLCVVRALCCFHGNTLLAAPSPYSPYSRRRQAAAQRVRLTEPRRVVLPLSQDQVQSFWASFDFHRDLALIGLMLLDGLRSAEVLALKLADLDLTHAQLRIQGKGNKERMVPLPQDLIDTLQNYLILERPPTCSPALFVCLKGRSRGLALTPAGLRSLFRHHRAESSVAKANPHRFRHTFGADMVRAGISLPALQRLMGHAHIRTTMLYVQIAPQDVWQQYHLAVSQRTWLPPSSK